MRFRQLVFTLVLVLLCGCGQEGGSVFQTSLSGQKVAEVGNYYITDAQVHEIAPRGFTAEDSLAWVNSYVKNWVIDHILLSKASWSSDEQAEIDRLVEEYRQQLIIERYQKSIIKREYNRNLSTRLFSSSSNSKKEKERALIDSIPDKTQREAAHQVVFLQEYRDDLYEKAIKSGAAVVR